MKLNEADTSKWHPLDCWLGLSPLVSCSPAINHDDGVMGFLQIVIITSETQVPILPCISL